MNTLIASSVLILFAQSAPEDGPATVVLTRAKALELAARQNPQLVAQRADQLVAEARLGQVDAAKHPTLNVTVGVLTSIAAENSDQDENGVRSARAAYGDFNIDQLRPGFIGRLTAVQPLYTFGKIGLREKAAEAGLEAAKAQAEMGAADILIEVARIYEAHLYAKDVLLFVKDIEGVASRSIEETKARLEVGAFDVKPQDLLRLQTALGAARLVSHYASGVIDQTREGLRAYLGFPPGTKLEISEAFLDPVSMNPTAFEEMVAMARENRPELVALDRGIAAYDHLAAAERADYFPNIFALGYVSGAYTVDRDIPQSRFVVDPLGHFVAGALVGAQWTLEWDMAGHRADEVRAESFRLQNMLEWAETGVPAEGNRFHQEVQRARLDMKQLEETLPLTQEWVVRASADYSAGFDDSRGLTDAVQAFVVMKNNQLDAVYRLNINLAELAKATGTLAAGPQALYPGEPR